MPRIERRARIEAPVATCFSYLDDASHATTYLPGLVRFEPRSATTSGIGATFAAKIDAGPMSYESTVTITGWERDRCIHWSLGDAERSERDAGTADTVPTLKGSTATAGSDPSGQSLTWTLEPDGEATIATVVVELVFPSGIAGALLSATVEPMVRSRAEAALAKVKAALEGAADDQTL